MGTGDRELYIPSIKPIAYTPYKKQLKEPETL